ncbi:hypothetical protein RND71_010082 [Anisodus tanguticus]|uniref:Uncharacterized protein n=1 Tax=Anisodus tanguticus TaxID=243964 RepID=A0AAE1SJN7_9SOLA|nr:hypothetical protein RND71_010082 [Anisodus tanguticus]
MATSVTRLHTVAHINGGLWRQYKRWIRRNKHFVLKLDTLANNVQYLTWLFPDEFAESEIGPEAGFVLGWLSSGIPGTKCFLQGGESENAENDSDSFCPQETKRQLDKPIGNKESGITKNNSFAELAES